jgi:hypothetical protein
MIDWSKCEDVERVPGKVSGQWIGKGTPFVMRGLDPRIQDTVGVWASGISKKGSFTTEAVRAVRTWEWSSRRTCFLLTVLTAS